MIATEKKKKCTVADYKALPEGDRRQLIHGELVLAEPAPTYGHQERSLDIATQIRNHLRENPVGKVVCAPVDVYLDKKNVLQPDIVYISNERKHLIKEDGVHGGPDLVIEILSPSTGYYDMKVKKNLYEKAGVKEFWIVDPADEEVTGYENRQGEFIEVFRGRGRFFSKILHLEIKTKL